MLSLESSARHLQCLTSEMPFTKLHFLQIQLKSILVSPHQTNASVQTWVLQNQQCISDQENEFIISKNSSAALSVYKIMKYPREWREIIFLSSFFFSFGVKGHICDCMHPFCVLGLFYVGQFLLLGTLAITSVPLFMSFQKMAQPVWLVLINLFC